MDWAWYKPIEKQKSHLMRKSVKTYSLFSIIRTVKQTLVKYLSLVHYCQPFREPPQKMALCIIKHFTKFYGFRCRENNYLISSHIFQKKKKVKIITLSDTLQNKFLRKKDIQEIHTSDPGSHFGVWACLIIYRVLPKVAKVENSWALLPYKYMEATNTHRATPRMTWRIAEQLFNN